MSAITPTPPFTSSHPTAFETITSRIKNLAISVIVTLASFFILPFEWAFSVSLITGCISLLYLFFPLTNSLPTFQLHPRNPSPARFPSHPSFSEHIFPRSARVGIRRSVSATSLPTIHENHEPVGRTVIHEPVGVRPLVFHSHRGAFVPRTTRTHTRQEHVSVGRK